jgi:hypothetical protein
VITRISPHGVSMRASRRRRPAWTVPALLGLALAGVPAAAQEAAPSPEPEPAVQLPVTDRPTLRILSFGDANFTSRAEDTGKSAFGIGPFVLYATSRLSEHWSALGELVFENDDNALATDLERILVGWQASDLLRVRVGREHNPLVRWNTALHHGLYMQTPIERPSMARFEDDGGPWPVHFVGMLADGRVDSMGLIYGAAVGNGRGAIPDEVQVTFDRNGNKALVGWLGYAPPAVVGLEVSLTGYADRLPAETGELRERAWTLSGTYLGKGWELRSEYGQIDHRTTDDQRFRTTGWYALAAYGLRHGTVKPYVVLDHMRVPETDPFLAGIPDREGFVFGTRWDPDPRAALKAEVASQRVGGGERTTAVRAQLAVAF